MHGVLYLFSQMYLAAAETTKNLNWRESDQFAIFTRLGRGVELGTTKNKPI